MVEQNEHLDGEEAMIDDSSPEEHNNLREARKIFIAAILTPVYWFVLAMITLWWGPGVGDSVFASVLWGVLALIYTGALAYAGVVQTRMIRRSEDQRGLIYARGTVIVGAFFTVVGAILTVGFLAG
jgi:hypothetical protein